MKRNVRYLILIGLMMLFSSSIWAQPQQNIAVNLSGFEGRPFVDPASKSIASFIREVNSAYRANRRIDTAKLQMTSPARKSVMRLWQNSPFYCKSSSLDKIISNIGQTDEYEVRGVPFYFKNKEDDDHDNECSFIFDNTGKITAFHISVKQNCYNNIFNYRIDGDSVSETRNRLVILDNLERLRTAYEEKDINFLDQIYSDNALIITGRSIMTGEVIKTDYTTHTKNEYITKLRQIFLANARVRVEFSDIQFRILKERPGIYGTRLVQDWKNSNGYHDTGYLFLVWDFTGSRPMIHVRVWQNKFKPDGSTLPPRELIGLEDIEID